MTRLRTGNPGRLCAFLAVLGLLPRSEVPQEPAPFADFIRVLHQWPWEKGQRHSSYVMQTSVRTLRHAHSGVEVVLVSMHHIARPEAYASRETYLRSADVVVVEAETVSRSEQARLEREHPQAMWILRKRKAHARILGLATQGEWEENLGLKNTVWLNMSTAEFLEAGYLDHFSPISEASQKSIEQMEDLDPATLPPDELARIRRDLLGRYFGNIMQETDPATETSFFATDRFPGNRILLKGILELAKSGNHERIAVLYGGGHFTYLWPRLRARGFEEIACQWVDIMYFDAGEAWKAVDGERQGRGQLEGDRDKKEAR